MVLKKFHCDGAWLKSPFFDKSFGWGPLFFALYYILPTGFSPSKIFMYTQTPLSLFLTFDDTDRFLPFCICCSQASKVLAFNVQPSGLLIDLTGRTNTSKGKCTPHVDNAAAHT